MHHFLFMASALLTVNVASAQTPFSQKPFSDVPKSHMHYEAIEYLRQNNVIRGYLDGTFKPDTRINRAEFLQLITNPFLLNTTRMGECIREEFQGKEEVTYVFYTDVAKDEWYAAPVCLATVQKIINGYPDKTFRPANRITFVEASKIIARVFAFQIEEEEGDQWYVPYVDKLSDRQAIPTTIASLREEITRGEMAEMIYRLKANVTTKQSRTAKALAP